MSAFNSKQVQGIVEQQVQECPMRLPQALGGALLRDVASTKATRDIEQAITNYRCTQFRQSFVIRLFNHWWQASVRPHATGATLHWKPLQDSEFITPLMMHN